MYSQELMLFLQKSLLGSHFHWILFDPLILATIESPVSLEFIEMEYRNTHILFHL